VIVVGDERAEKPYVRIIGAYINFYGGFWEYLIIVVSIGEAVNLR